MAVVKRVQQGDTTLICADLETELKAQKVRMLAWAVGGPSLIYLASRTPKRMIGVRAWLFASGAACTAWHLSVWQMVNKAIERTPE
jgi:hypothetical protein|tara:strand:- start:172 stop:429 length:258 start_codon:yes stop_codon:yes gene_type:complete